MKISVVIIAKNEARYIKDCLKSLFQQTYRDFEIVVIDNGSTDGTGEIIKSSVGKIIKYFYEPSKIGIAALRNLGIKNALGKYIFFTDADCMPSKHWLETGLSILETEDYVGVEGKTYYEIDEKTTISDYNTHQSFAGERALDTNHPVWPARADSPLEGAAGIDEPGGAVWGAFSPDERRCDSHDEAPLENRRWQIAAAVHQ